MHLKAAFLLAVAAGTVLLVASCGSSEASGADPTVTVSPGAQPSGSGSTATAPAAPSTPVPSSGSTICQALTPTTYLGGNLFVAEQGTIGVTLLSDGALGPLIFDDIYSFGRGFMIVYDNVLGIPVPNRQDWFGFAKPFAAGTSIGSSIQVQLLPPSADVTLNYGPAPSTFPKGIPLQLWLKKYDGAPPSPANSSATASIGKDFYPEAFPNATVTYGANNTATVTFFSTTDGSHFSVGLTNVFGTGCPKPPPAA